MDLGGVDLDLGRYEQRREVGGEEADPAVGRADPAVPRPHEVAAGEELIEHGGPVVADPARQDQRLPRRRRKLMARQLVENCRESVDAGESFVVGDVLPGSEESGEGRSVDRRDLGAACRERATSDLPEDVAMTPLRGPCGAAVGIVVGGG
ncbi:Uncharacterised protein [Mycobacteroides abscessus subsp. abscessus]|nr:Uncharacterised protein [Mycobacteroides abscessus subsp. abscessus]